MIFDLIVKNTAQRAGQIAPEPVSGVVLSNGAVAMPGTKISVGWAEAVDLIGRGKAKAAPGEIIPLLPAG